MIKGRPCPACKSEDTGWLMTVGNREEFECLTCSNIWTRPAGNSELRHVDPLAQWGATGEEE